jgi:hypothetical protein
LSGFRCPGCGAADSLQIGRSIELGADARSDEITLQLVDCTTCSLRGIAVYEESRRGGMDAECVEHIGFRVAAAERARLEQLLAACPQPRNEGCGCAAHRELRRFDAAGRWSAPEACGSGFAMQPAR